MPKFVVRVTIFDSILPLFFKSVRFSCLSGSLMTEWVTEAVSERLAPVEGGLVGTVFIGLTPKYIPH